MPQELSFEELSKQGARPKELSFEELQGLGAAPQAEKKGPGILETVARHGTQGLTFGHADEAAGLLGAATEPLFMKSDKGFGDRYKEYRNAHRAEDKAATEANPMTAAASELAGGLLAPGGVAKKGVGVAGNLLRSAVGGGVSAVGKSESENPEDLAYQGLLGAGAGAASSAAGQGINAITPSVDKLGAVAKVAAKNHLGEEATADQIGKALRYNTIKFGEKSGAKGLPLHQDPASIAAHMEAMHRLYQGHPLDAILIAGTAALAKGRTASSIAATANAAKKGLMKRPGLEKAFELGGKAIESGAPVLSRQVDYNE